MKVLLNIMAAVFLYGQFGLCAQDLVLLKVQVSREVPEMDFTKDQFLLDYWLQEKEKLVALDPEATDISLFNTDQGQDLIQLHQKVVQDYHTYVEEQAKRGRIMFTSRTGVLLDPGKVQVLDDTVGFRFEIDCWALPAAGTSFVELKGTLVYKVVDQDAKVQKVSVDLEILGRENQVMVDQDSITISQYGSSNIGDKQWINYQVDRIEFPYALEKLEVYNEKDEMISNPRSSGYVVGIPPEFTHRPLRLVFHYKGLKTKSYNIDTRVGLGL
ncbi:MAG: hypothetical protein OER04_15665 [Cyclobacteriaceae bacterium]|nr:hypothetical protein [Cyclobacteriaceae bacterium]